MEGVVSSWELREDIRGILIPLSDTAVYSTKLPQNQANVKRVDSNATTPERLSPPNSPYKLDGTPEGLTGEPEPQSPNRLSSENAILLCQSKDLDRFTFGADLRSFFVLRSNPASKEDAVCYINLLHCHFYPDPDSFDLWIQNSSTSIQTAEGLSITHSLSPTESVRLGPGSWRLNLGLGLGFALHIPPIVAQAQPLSDSRPTQRTSQVVGRSITKAQSRKRSGGTKSGAALSVPDPATVTSQHKISKAPVKNQGSLKQQASKIGDEAPHESTSLLSPRTIGETYHSKVVESRFLGQRVVIKYCRRPNVPTAASMWRSEVRALKSLKKHHNIVDILDSNASKYTITLELVPGASLEKYVDDDFWSTLTEQQSKDVRRGAAIGLQYLHEKGYLHNDLKAENVMYDPVSQRTVLIDFGVATYYSHKFFSSGGTPCYVAPEYLRRQRLPASDGWALGILSMFFNKLIQLPREHWKLSDVFEDDSEDALAMRYWLTSISNTVKQARSPDAELIRRMVCDAPGDRITSGQLVSCLAPTRELAIENQTHELQHEGKQYLAAGA